MLPGCTIIPCARSAEVFDCVENGKAKGAVVPIENTLAGSVPEHFDLLLARNVSIHREFYLRIVHNLIANNKISVSKIHRVYSHPIALDQCRNFLQQNPKMESIPYYDTAGSVRHVIDKEMDDAAAIASQLAAKIYHGVILKKDIEDNKQNFTRFFLIRKAKPHRYKGDKISLVFSLKNEPGILFKALSVFALRNIHLSKIESRPVRGKPWEYVFYIDLLHRYDAVLQNALRHITEIAEMIKLLGVYPAAKK